MFHTLKTAFKLGPLSIGWVLLHRVLQKTGVYAWMMPIRNFEDRSTPLFYSPVDSREIPLDSSGATNDSQKSKPFLKKIQQFFHRVSQFFFDSSSHSPHPSNLAQDSPSLQNLLHRADRITQGFFIFFSHTEKEVGSPPRWFKNPDTEQSLPETLTHWSRLQEFNLPTGDIKILWELCRFDWCVTLAKAHQNTQQRRYLETLNHYLLDWMEHNPLHAGVHWKCGQEAAIRVLHLLMAADILGQLQKPSRNLLNLIGAHLRRIIPTLHYGIAQNNNHGVVETAAVWLGSAWMHQHQPRPFHALTSRFGKYCFQQRLKKLVLSDGTFSQYSVNYHRVVLNTLSFCEHLRKQLGLTPCTPLFYQRFRKMTTWLYTVIDPITGDAPNLGQNDGALVFSMVEEGYRNFRASIQMACAQLNLKNPYAPKINEATADSEKIKEPSLGSAESSNESASESSEKSDFHSLLRVDPLKKSDLDALLRVDPLEESDFRPLIQPRHPIKKKKKKKASQKSGVSTTRLILKNGDLKNPPVLKSLKRHSRYFNEGGFSCLIRGKSMGLLRHPQFRYRPAQCDALHFDLWHRGINLLRDDGTFSYHLPPEHPQHDYFGSATAHNTVQFDDHPQMQKLRRFLYGPWLEPAFPGYLEIIESTVVACAGYRDLHGAIHTRTVFLHSDHCRIVDHLSGFQHHARLRWRLNPGEWTLESNRCISMEAQITLDFDAGNLKLITGYESRYYLQQTEIPVLELTISRASSASKVSIVTNVDFV